jgi:uncharacterized protein (DUF4415 family)
MKQTSTTKTSAIVDDDAPKLKQAHFDRAKFRLGEKTINRVEWQSAVRARVGKQRISIMLDTPIVDHYKAMAGDRGYQTLINDTLRRVIEGEYFMNEMRSVIREELKSLVTEKK